MDIVFGLETYADDYVTKPFKEKVLTARVRAVIRRRQEIKKHNTIHINGIIINAASRSVSINQQTVTLSKTEFCILHFIASKPGWVFSKGQISEAVTGEIFATADRAIDMQIIRLKKKLREAGKYIETVRGVGYRFVEK